MALHALHRPVAPPLRDGESRDSRYAGQSGRQPQRRNPPLRGRLSAQLPRGLTSGGQIFDFAENLVSGDSEFAGPVYTPDGKWLVVAIQRPGITVAITGPWGSGQL